uniref:aspartyl aminopeptidase n=1 Tax=Plectus sambesii TaxID=2011161 RepID=A0A914V928_9BILA
MSKLAMSPIAPNEALTAPLMSISKHPTSSAITGAHNEFICGARLDNLVGTYTAVTGLIESLKDDAGLSKDMNIRIAACFDNEECGSESAQGAASAVTEWFLRRMASGGHASAFEEAVSKSYLISADQAHACHPNYRAKHEENHQPMFHGGVVVKTNVNQRYATTGITHAILKVIAEKAQVPLQNFVVRNDSPCGSTVGPILSAKLGLQTIDVGTAQFAMHSIREMTDTSGVMHAINLFTTFYNTLPGVLSNFKM